MKQFWDKAREQSLDIVILSGAAKYFPLDILGLTFHIPVSKYAMRQAWLNLNHKQSSMNMDLSSPWSLHTPYNNSKIYTVLDS
jgi:hypothetical protein